MSNNPAVARAESAFAKKEQRAREGEAAMSAYRAEARATDAKTARLRALRLAKEAADREAALAAPPPKPAAKPRTVRKAKV